MKHFLYLTLLSIFSLFGLSSCKIDGEEEITLRKDGSGEMRVVYIFPNKVFSKKDAQSIDESVKAICERHDTLHVLECYSEPHGSLCRQINLKLGFDSAIRLREVVSMEKKKLDGGDSGQKKPKIVRYLKALIGRMDINLAATGLDYQRQMNLAPLFQGTPVNADLLKNCEFRYTLNLPFAAGENNADQVLNEGKTLMWHLPLDKHIEDAFQMKAEMTVRPLLYLWGSLAGIVILVILLIWVRKSSVK